MIKAGTVGVVSGCETMNIRSEPSLIGEVLCSVQKGSEVMLTEDSMQLCGFYHVCTASGIEGYCIKKFITFKEE